MYPALLDDLATRRSNQINTASETRQCGTIIFIFFLRLLVPVQNNPMRRQAALKKFSKNARTHFEEVKETEKVRIQCNSF